ncbi:unnamed protein product [Malus baccata var. baccata]
MPLKLKEKFYRTAIRPAMLYGTECWAVKHQHDASLDVWRKSVPVIWTCAKKATDAPVRRCDYGTEVQGQRGRGRPRKTLEETLRKDLEYLVLTEDMTQNRAQ